MRQSRHNWLIVAVVILTTIIACQTCAFSAPRKSTLSSKIKKVKSIKAKISAVKHKIRVKEHEKRTVIGQLSVTEAKLETAQESLTGNKIKYLNAQTKLNATIARLARTRKQLSRRRALLGRRVTDIYEGEDLGFVNVVLGATNMWTFLTRAYYLQRILDADTALIADIRRDEAAIEADKAAQTRQVAQIQALQVRLEGERDQIAGLADTKKRQLSAIESSKQLMQEALDELERESNAIEDQIRQIQNTPAGIRRSNRAFRGGLSLPVSGRITSRFGYRVHPITGVYKLHTGVDLSCRTGTPIHAAADGIVTMAKWMGAYGYAVVIDHGGRVSTLYGHNSKLLVSAGQSVTRGQTIARAGSTGYSTGSHCHFEKRVNGTPVNPM